MKTTLNILLALLAVYQFSIGQTLNSNSETWNSAQKRAYSYGVQTVKAQQMFEFNAYETNAEEFIRGFVKGFEGDSALVAISRNVLKDRLTNGTVATTPAEGAKIAYAAGVGAIGDLALEIEIPTVDFDLKALRVGFEAVLAGEKLALSDKQMDSILSAYFEPKLAAYQQAIEAKKEAAAWAKAIRFAKGNPVQQLSYSYGIKMAELLLEMDVIRYEKDIDQLATIFVKGFEVGLEGNSASIAAVEDLLHGRTSDQRPTLLFKRALKHTYAHGVRCIGYLAQKIAIPAQDFDLAALKVGFAAVLAREQLALTEEKRERIMAVYFEGKLEELERD